MGALDFAQAMTGSQNTDPAPVVDSPLNAESDSPFGGRKMLQEVIDRNMAKRQPQEPEAPAARPDYEILKSQNDLLQKQIDEMRRTQTDVRGLAERQTNLLETLRDQGARANQPKPEPLPVIEHDDPDLVAALNTLEQRIMRQVSPAIQNAQHSAAQYALTHAEREFKQTLDKFEKMPHFTEYFPDRKAWEGFAAPYLSNPQFAGKVNWENELQLAYNARDYERVKKENEDLKRNSQASAKERQREEQRANAGNIPRIGHRSGATAGGASGGTVGEQIINDYRAKGKRPSFKQFGAELMRRRQMA